MVAWAEFGFAKVYGTLLRGTKEKNMEESNVSTLESEIRVTEDDIPGAKAQMNDNLVPCNGPRRLCETKLDPGYHSFLKWRID